MVATKAKQLPMTNNNAAFGEMIPLGISLTAVRGFFKSISLSRYLLNAIAALRANTMQSKTNPSLVQSKEILVCNVAMKKPTNAKGNAKMV